MQMGQSERVALCHIVFAKPEWGAYKLASEAAAYAVS